MYQKTSGTDEASISRWRTSHKKGLESLSTAYHQIAQAGTPIYMHVNQKKCDECKDPSQRENGKKHHKTEVHLKVTEAVNIKAAYECAVLTNVIFKFPPLRMLVRAG